MSSSSSHRKRSPSPPSTSKSLLRPTKKPRPPPSFPTYLTSPTPLPPHLLPLLRLLSSPSPPPPQTLDPLIQALPLTPSDVELVLKLSYSAPSSALLLLRLLPPTLLSPYSLNLSVDLLGKNRLFHPMWDSVSHMLSRRALSLATFASVFSSYAAASRFDDALKVFDDMQARFGVPRDAAALNSLLSAVCREGEPVVARNILRMRKNEVMPDGDSYAILLEGLEEEGDGRLARQVFDEMVGRVGWDPKNVPAYDSFLCTLVKGGAGGMKYALRYLGELREKRCYPGMKFFRLAMEELVKSDDARGARVLWETLVGRNECYPDAKMYSLMIKLQCYDDRTDEALKYLDDMVLYGAFPDAKTYNVVLERLLKRMRTKYAAAIFDEMVLNEFVPSESNCVSGIKIFLDARDWDMGLKVWKCMVDNGYPLEESGNLLVTRSKECDRLPEGCKVAEDMIDRRVKLTSANLSRLRGNLVQMGKLSMMQEGEVGHLLWKNTC